MALNLSEENVGVVSIFRECKKNHTLSMGVYTIDGCMAFVPDYSKENGMVCRGCGCYRSFHCIEVIKPAVLPQHQVGDLFHREEEVIKAGENPQLLPREEVIVPPADPQPPVGFFHREEVINPAANQEPEVGSFSHSKEKMNPVANPQVGSLVPNDHAQVHGSGSTVSQIIDLTGEDDENLVENQAVAAFVEPSNVRPNSISAKPKRKMKNFSQEETAKMVAMAWELELKMPGRDKLMKAKLEAFCREMGVKWLNFKAWLHTHKKELILGRIGRYPSDSVANVNNVLD